MKKYLYLCCILSTAILADDLDLGADFSAGDTISAAEFNSRFNTIENVIKKFDESILIGTWSCLEYSVGNINSDTGKFINVSDLKTVTFSETDNLSSIESPKMHNGFSFSHSGTDDEPQTTYSMIGNMFVPTYLVTNSSGAFLGVDDSQTFDIELRSNDQFQMTATKSRSNNCGINGCFVVSVICNKS